MGKPLIPAQRRERIQAYLTTRKIVATAELCELLEVSEATVRRDLEWLEEQGLVERTHGGAILNERVNLEQEYQQRAQRFPEAKRRIGALAASLINNGDIVFINSGTTTTQLIRQIPVHADSTIITNNLVAALEIGEVNYELLLLGGSFQPRSNSVAGRFAINNLSQVYATKAFIGVDGFSLKHGYTVPSNAEAEVVHLMLERTQGEVYVVADHSKWGVVSNFEIAPIDRIKYLITDDGLDVDARASLANRSVEIMIPSGITAKA
ncbi:MAG TPA: DeoR/GlpR family DNA-binding transcription regulator [Anaerolineales bacterium]|nr:DeoR/GlpR family DNA-binding transcription regulator [Anaerolineales bacterium]